MGINIGLYLIKWEFETMANYLDLVAEAIEQRLAGVEEKYDVIIANAANEFEASMVEDQFTDEFLEAGQHFPSLLLTSFIIAWYSFVEQELIKLCKDLKLTITISPGEKTNIETGVRLARRFLLQSKNYEIDDNHWQELTKIGRLRNILVHEGTRFEWTFQKPSGQYVPYKISLDSQGTVYIKNLGKDHFQYLQKHKIIERSGIFFEIRPSFEYGKHLVEFGLEFFLKLYSDLYPRSASTDDRLVEIARTDESLTSEIGQEL